MPAARPIEVARSTPEKGLNPYFIHPEDSTGWPSGPHCAAPGSVECIWCVVPDNHEHLSTKLWRFDAGTGEIKSVVLTCRSRTNKDGFPLHDWLLNFGPAGSNANLPYLYKSLGWTDDESLVLDQRLCWLAARVRKEEAAATASLAALAQARSDFKEALRS